MSFLPFLDKILKIEAKKVIQQYIIRHNYPAKYVFLIFSLFERGIMAAIAIRFICATFCRRTVSIGRHLLLKDFRLTSMYHRL